MRSATKVGLALEGTFGFDWDIVHNEADTREE